MSYVKGHPSMIRFTLDLVSHVLHSLLGSKSCSSQFIRNYVYDKYFMRTISDKILKDRAFEIARNCNYYG